MPILSPQTSSLDHLHASRSRLDPRRRLGTETYYFLRNTYLPTCLLPYVLVVFLPIKIGYRCPFRPEWSCNGAGIYAFPAMHPRIFPYSSTNPVTSGPPKKVVTIQ